MSYNSVLAVYFLLLTSGRLASYRPEPLVEEMRGVPFAPPEDDMLAGLKTLEDVDERVRKVFGFKDAEWTLIDDLFRYTLPDFQGDGTSPGRQPTRKDAALAQPTKSEPQLAAYCRYFTRVLKAGFGQDKAGLRDDLQDAADSPLPVRLVAIHLDWPRDEPILVEPIDSAALCDRLMELDERWLKTGDQNRGGIFYQRVAMVYSEFEHQKRSIPDGLHCQAGPHSLLDAVGRPPRCG